MVFSSIANVDAVDERGKSAGIDWSTVSHANERGLEGEMTHRQNHERFPGGFGGANPRTRSGMCDYLERLDFFQTSKTQFENAFLENGRPINLTLRGSTW
jgi:hypothetical protein